MTRRTVLVAVMAWVAVVGLGSVGTWLVIDSAGQHVLGRAGSPLVPGPPALGPSQSPTAPRSSPSFPQREASTSTPPGPSAPPSPAAPSPTTYLERAWRGTSGSVVVHCSHGRASLASATPSDGYRVEVGARGPGEVQVTFKGREREVQVKAVCSGQAPWFSVEGSSDD